MPLEKNTVRFIENFSQGTRGSSSAESFLRLGYAVIFLYRKNTLQPFLRHFKVADLLQWIELTPGDSSSPDGWHCEAVDCAASLLQHACRALHHCTIALTPCGQDEHIILTSDSTCVYCSTIVIS